MAVFHVPDNQVCRDPGPEMSFILSVVLSGETCQECLGAGFGGLWLIQALWDYSPILGPLRVCPKLQFIHKMERNMNASFLVNQLTIHDSPL